SPRCSTISRTCTSTSTASFRSAPSCLRRSSTGACSTSEAWTAISTRCTKGKLRRRRSESDEQGSAERGVELLLAQAVLADGDLGAARLDGLEELVAAAGDAVGIDQPYPGD